MFIFYHFIILFSNIILLHPCLPFPVLCTRLTAHCSSRPEKTLCSLTACAKMSWEHLPKPVWIGTIFSGTQNPRELLFGYWFVLLTSLSAWERHMQCIHGSDCWFVDTLRSTEVSSCFLFHLYLTNLLSHGGINIL